jgi:hypothetical protein
MSNARYTRWRKSSNSNDSANCVEVAAGWRKSSYSDANGECVEVADTDRRIAVRDTKQHGRGPVLEFPTHAWRDFLAQAKSGKLGTSVG